MSIKLLSRLTTLVIGLLPFSTQAAPAPLEARVIVKFKAESTELKRAQALDLARSLSGRLGLTLQAVHEPAPGIRVLRARGLASEELARRMSLLPDVSYAVPDRLKRIRSIPNDPLFAGQWYLKAGQPAALNVVSAWDRLLGGTGPVVAVLDTGIRADHPDLAGKIVPGYDFISEDIVGDGDGRDDDPSDPGDFISAQESLAEICGEGTPVTNSSWHGTRVAGIVAAATNNNVGIAGLSRNGRILPLRVLGKCGGFDSDIIAAMRWAAGLGVPGVPANPYPARIINLSLAGPGSCSSVYLETVKEIAAQGTLIVAAAGNDTGPVEEPANCAGVLGVAGLRHVGTKVGYSSLGPEVGISAPAGNCVNTGAGEECLFPINTTTNLGLSTPSTSGYTDGFDYNVGTSFSTPQAAGVAALMLEVHPGLPVDEILRRIKAAANAFPVDPSLPTCPVVGAIGSGIEGQCNCTASTCGAGMLDADKSIAQALAPAAAIAALDSPVANANIRLDGSSSTAAVGRVITSWTWTLARGPTGASLSNSAGATASLRATQAGDYVIRLEIADNLGATAATESLLSIVADTEGGGDDDGGDGGGGGGGLDWATQLGLLALGLLAYLSRRRRG